ncbi:aldehyde dehydrogenase family protein [Pseudodesulfovibrio thermohalotolerans]|uniref:aldehyde dehydrogenase family protein n=1 Tax=Pseudodesulfovibrio thermohalotolerans TaxID=2880651 RepID=UPI00244214DA|nr:aldehyde dehydrogenase family protein [Pseudodesulfovibrio thermohalotolerans]WFS61566.1 aldehyde dehydrogenase family protein [Pseudodesulfovibrio thermohalotolerans]
MSTSSTLFPEESDIPEPFRFDVPLETAPYLLDGRIMQWDGEMERVDSVIETAVDGVYTPKHLGSCPVMDEAAGAAAVASTLAAWDNGMGLWPTMGVADRIGHVEELTRRMIEARDEIARLMLWEIGKPYRECLVEFDRTVEYIHDTIDALRELDRASSRFVEESGIYAQIRRAPLGPTLCMGPYNYPLNETFATLIPALLMGNPAIIKAPRRGRLFFIPLLKAFRDCFPAGVINLVFGGRHLVRPILESGAINVLAFIGSSKAAKALRMIHPSPNRLRCILGLGAKNAAVVMESADMDLAVSEAVSGSLAFSGQRCTALKILFVHENVVDEFIRRFNKGVAKMPVGMPWEEGVRITPLPEPGKIEYLSELVGDAVAHGAKVVNPGGGEADRSLFHPTVLYPVNSDMRVYHEEQFGPVVPIVPFRDVETPVRYIVESSYGQQMSIFSDDAAEVASLVDPMVNQVCRVNVNSLCQRGPDIFPFSGRKDSAEGTLSVDDALNSFSIRTLVAAKDTPRNKSLLSDIASNHKSNFLSADLSA